MSIFYAQLIFYLLVVLASFLAFHPFEGLVYLFSLSHLMPLFDVLQNLFVADRVHVMKLFHVTLALDSDERLAERDGTETPVKEKQALVRIDPQEVRHVDVVGKCC